MRALVLTLVLAAATPALAGTGKPAYVAILADSDARPDDTTAQERALARIDAEIAANGGEALNHYVRGKILSRLGRDADAVTAYDEAFKRDKKLAEAQYNAGVVLARGGRGAEAVKRFDQALKIDPKLVDAAYNAGQAYYDLKDFKKALLRFQRAHELAPDDFAAAKKVMQAQLALGREKDAWKTREAVFALHRTSKDPEVQKLTEYVLDQFEVGALHVMAYETFDPVGDLFYVYTFKAFAKDNKLVGTVQLESSAVIREQGTPFILGVQKGAQHSTLPVSWKQLPKYLEVRKAATATIAAELVAHP